MKFLIYAPPYQNWTAGGRVLHRLCHLLNVVGEDAALYGPPCEGKTNRDWKTPILYGLVGSDNVAVYPEVVSGNPLAAPHVVRYVLNHPGLLAGDKVFPASEMVFYYDDWLRESASKATYPIGELLLGTDRFLPPGARLCISVIDPAAFYSDCSVPKQHDATYVGRGEPLISARFLRPDESLPIYPIMRYDPPSRWELGNFLRKTRALYTMDDRTALCVEAKACGARVIYVSGKIENFELVESHTFDLTDGIDIRNLVLDYQRTDHVKKFAALVKERFG